MNLADVCSTASGSKKPRVFTIDEEKREERERQTKREKRVRAEGENKKSCSIKAKESPLPSVRTSKPKGKANKHDGFSKA